MSTATRRPAPRRTRSGAARTLAAARPDIEQLLPRATLVSVLLMLTVVSIASVVSAQPPTVPEQPLVLEGRILWVDFGSQTLVVAPDNGPAVTIDLRRIRQGDYHGFRGNEYVRVVGFILRPSRRIQAYELYLVSPWYPLDPERP
jgi:hypothetical protein